MRRFLRGAKLSSDGRYIRPRLYHVWCSMRKRCTNPNHNSYPWYGAKGVTICKEWDDYAVFRQWALNAGYRKGLEIDRVDSDGNYEPANCRWVTRLQNQPRLKLTANDVRTIRRSRFAVPRLAEIYGVHATHIKRIRDGDARKDVK